MDTHNIQSERNKYKNQQKTDFTSTCIFEK